MQTQSHSSAKAKSSMPAIKWEDEDTPFELDGREENEFARLFAGETAENVKEGTIVKGRVVRLTSDSVIVDIGHKAEGEVPKRNL